MHSVLVRVNNDKNNTSQDLFYNSMRLCGHFTKFSLTVLNSFILQVFLLMSDFDFFFSDLY